MKVGFVCGGGVWNQEIFIKESWECKMKPLCAQWHMSYKLKLKILLVFLYHM